MFVYMKKTITVLKQENLDVACNASQNGQNNSEQMRCWTLAVGWLVGLVGKSLTSICVIILLL